MFAPQLLDDPADHARRARGDVRLDRHVQAASAALQAQDLHLTQEPQRFGERR